MKLVHAYSKFARKKWSWKEHVLKSHKKYPKSMWDSRLIALSRQFNDLKSKCQQVIKNGIHSKQL